MKTLFIVACILLLTMPALHGEDTVAAARDLYTAANYEDALAVLGRLESQGSQPAERMAVNQYRAFCLLALGRMAEAERAIESVLTVDLLYHPVDADMSPRLRSAFAGVRQRILPAIVQQEYARAKAAFERQDFPAALAQFDRVLKALSDPDLGGVSEGSPLADLRTLAGGFRDLSAKAMEPPPVVAAPPQPEPVVSAAPALRSIYGSGDTGVSPPVIMRQTLPPFPREAVSRRDGVLEVVINEAGDVESAVMRSPINPRYDQIVIGAARTWKYAPATVGGTPVKFRKLISIALKTPS